MNDGSIRPGGDRGRRSRRQLIAGATGALGALAAGTLVNSPPAQAAQGQPVIEGSDNTGATSRTGVFTPGNKEWATLADPNTSGRGSLGVYGYGQDIGVLGDTQGGIGVSGETSGTSSPGVRGLASDPSAGVGVLGSGASAGVWGQGLELGVRGITSGFGGIGVAGSGDTGVSGTGGSIGVHGDTQHGNGTGVEGIAVGSGTGVFGTSSSGNGVVAASTSGVALLSDGPATFLGTMVCRRSGSAAIHYPATSATVSVPGGLGSSAVALAVLQNAVPGVWVTSAVPNVSTGNLIIGLNKAPGSAKRHMTARVAWFVVN